MQKTLAIVGATLAITLTGIAPRYHAVGERDRAVTLEVGSTLAVRLPVRLGTGYRWHVVKADKRFLELQGESTTQGTPKKLGGTQIQGFRFRAARIGTTTVLMEYRRPFGRQDPTPLKRYRLDVTIKPYVPSRDGRHD